jgi:phage tail-like protein
MPALPFGVNAVFSAAAGALGARLDPYLGYNFLVEVDGLIAGGFREVRGLEASVEVKEYAEGGRNEYIHKLPGATRHPPLVLLRGLTDLDTMWGWFEAVSRGVIQRRSMVIMLLDQQYQPAMYWDVHDALPVKWVGPQLNATGGTEVATESIELVHRGITRPIASRVLSASRAAMSQLRRQVGR